MVGNYDEDISDSITPLLEHLWQSAEVLRGAMEAVEYKHHVLPLIFLKYISESYDHQKEKIIQQGRNPEERKRYSMDGVYWVPEEARWADLAKKAKSKGIKRDLDQAMQSLEDENKELEGILKKDFSASEIPPRVIGELVDLFTNANFNIGIGTIEARSKDVLGRCYEYFIGKFANAEKKAGGEFYTPRSVVRLLAEILEPFDGALYDGCCGSGGMFIQSEKFVESRGGKRDLLVYGQEFNSTTLKLAKMNLIIKGIKVDWGEGPEDTLHTDWHKNELFDYCMANPPFNIKKWSHDVKTERWKPYEVPPEKSANYAWILHYLLHLKPKGYAGIIMSNSSLTTSQKSEFKIRQQIVKANDKLDCVVTLPKKLFGNTGISACIWILSNDKVNDTRYRSRPKETLFIDCRNLEGEMISRKQRELRDEDIDRIANKYRNWRSKKNFDAYEDESGFCKAATIEDIEEQGFMLVPGRFVGAPPLPDDGEPFEEKMQRFTKELGEHFVEGRELEQQIHENLAKLGFDL